VRLAPWVLAALVGCAGRPHSSPPTSPGRDDCVPVGQWIEPADRERVAYDRVIDHAADAEVVLLGEDHDSLEHHRWQLSVLSGLLASRPSIVVGLEALPRSAQATLDEWGAGRLDTSALLEGSAWRSFWGPDAEQYLPIAQWARLHRQPLRALNVSRALVSRVGREGWNAIPLAAREGVSDPASPIDAYRRDLARVYAEHACLDPARVTTSPGFARFVEAQLTWDRAMAEGLVAARRSRPHTLVVGITGRGHLEHGFGVPRQLRALGVRDVTVLLPWDHERSCSELTADLADGVFGVESPAEERETMARTRAALRPPCAAFQGPPR
jgi:uncharacterized iron-regulated protein